MSMISTAFHFLLVSARLGPRCGRGGDGRRAASRAIRRPRWERRLEPWRGGGNLPAREVLAVFSKPETYPGFADPLKPRTGTSSTWRHRIKDFESKKGAPPSIESVQWAAADPTGLTGLAAAAGYKIPPLSRWRASSLLSPFRFFLPPSPCSRLGPMSPTQRKVRL